MPSETPRPVYLPRGKFEAEERLLHKPSSATRLIKKLAASEHEELMSRVAARDLEQKYADFICIAGEFLKWARAKRQHRAIDRHELLPWVSQMEQALIPIEMDREEDEVREV